MSKKINEIGKELVIVEKTINQQKHSSNKVNNLCNKQDLAILGYSLVPVLVTLQASIGTEACGQICWAGGGITT